MGLMSKKMKRAVTISFRPAEGSIEEFGMGYVSMCYVMPYTTCYQTCNVRCNNAVCFVSVHLWLNQRYTVRLFLFISQCFLSLL